MKTLALARGQLNRPKIFVAYPYAFHKDEYRRPFEAVESSFGVEFHYADQRITNKHILDKITAMIAESHFSLFDITRWNANVTLELGVAIGRGSDFYLLFNPDDAQNPRPGDVPADLGGLDRIQYRTYEELERLLHQLLSQEFGPVRTDRGVSEDNRMTLTPTEVLLLESLARGLHGQELAYALPRSGLTGGPLSQRQVSRYIRSARDKLGARTSEEAIAEATRMGLIVA
jgi:hypothetical protein